ncbi:hypothetical protein NQZ68_035735 [Dissostichus eleginoides]|nr:hypothetical protein NQZ68_035735 [Dissostichus eleginoides]
MEGHGRVEGEMRRKGLRLICEVRSLTSELFINIMHTESIELHSAGVAISGKMSTAADICPAITDESVELHHRRHVQLWISADNVPPTGMCRCPRCSPEDLAEPTPSAVACARYWQNDI